MSLYHPGGGEIISLYVLPALFAPSGAVRFSKPSLHSVLLYPVKCMLLSSRMGEEYTFLWKAGIGAGGL